MSERLDIDENMQFSRAIWTVQMFAPWVLVAIIIAALMGVFGYGWLADDRLTTADGRLSLRYLRLAQMQTATKLVVDVREVSGSELKLWISGEYLSQVRIQRITPEAADRELQPDRVVYTFKIAPDTQHASITFYLYTADFGSQSGEVGLVGGPTLKFEQFVYP